MAYTTSQLLRGKEMGFSLRLVVLLLLVLPRLTYSEEPEITSVVDPVELSKLSLRVSKDWNDSYNNIYSKVQWQSSVELHLGVDSRPYKCTSVKLRDEGGFAYPTAETIDEFCAPKVGDDRAEQNQLTGLRGVWDELLELRVVTLEESFEETQRVVAAPKIPIGVENWKCVVEDFRVGDKKYSVCQMWVSEDVRIGFHPVERADHFSLKAVGEQMAFFSKDKGFFPGDVIVFSGNIVGPAATYYADADHLELFEKTNWAVNGFEVKEVIEGGAERVCKKERKQVFGRWMDVESCNHQ